MRNVREWGNDQHHLSHQWWNGVKVCILATGLKIGQAATSVYDI